MGAPLFLDLNFAARGMQNRSENIYPHVVYISVIFAIEAVFCLLSDFNISLNLQHGQLPKHSTLTLIENQPRYI